MTAGGWVQGQGQRRRRAGRWPSSSPSICSKCADGSLWGRCHPAPPRQSSGNCQLLPALFPSFPTLFRRLPAFLSRFHPLDLPGCSFDTDVRIARLPLPISQGLHYKAFIASTHFKPPPVCSVRHVKFMTVARGPQVVRFMQTTSPSHRDPAQLHYSVLRF